MRSDRHGVEALASLSRLVTDRASDPLRHKTKVCFVLGAGADISSGGQSFAALKRQAVEEFTKRRVFDITLPEQIDARFDHLFSTLEPDDRALLVETVFRRSQELKPSDAYKLLVLVAEAGGIDAIVTTNFDLMLEQAQFELGRNLFQVFAPGLARPYLVAPMRFDLPKKPYLKLHGDLGSRSVVLLTSADLEDATYDASMLELLQATLYTHDLVIAGYGGFDTALANIIATIVNSTTNRVYWCNPTLPSTDSPLYSRIVDRTDIIEASFDELMREVARPILERPSAVATEATYVRCLFDWRLEYCNSQYVRTYGQRSGKRVVETFARRTAIEARLAKFLQPNRPLAIIAGPSGYGKTTLGIRLDETWSRQHSTRIMLIPSRAVPDSGDIEQHVSEQLGGLGSRTEFSLYKLERWLKENGLRLVLFIDGINEFSTELNRCVQFFRGILRLCYFLPETDSALRVIATVRQETWATMLPHLDVGQLRETLWADGVDRSTSTIMCGPLTDEELRDALARFRDHNYATIDIGRLSPSLTDQLHDPYLLGIFADSVRQGLASVPLAKVYEQAFETKLRLAGTLTNSATLKDLLGRIALRCLEADGDRFREIDLQPLLKHDDVVRLMKDLHIFVDAGDGFLRFDHDRTFEFFLAHGLSVNAAPSLETLDDLRNYLARFGTQSKAVAAARLYFQLSAEKRFTVITTALGLLDRSDHRFSVSDRNLLFGFAREVVVEMAAQGELLAWQYLEDAIDAARNGNVEATQLRTVVQAVAGLPVERAIPLLTRVAHPTSTLAQTEANIYAIDMLAKHFLRDGRPVVDLLSDAPYAAFFGDTTISSWQRLGRVMSLAGQLGPDNTHPDEYASIARCLRSALDRLLTERPWSDADVIAVGEFFLANCDRLLFNATPHGVTVFFGNPRRHEFERILDKLVAGRCLDDGDVLSLEPYTQQLSADVEYHLTHVMFILSSFNDFDATLRLVESRFARFSNDTSPIEIDFFQATIVYLYVVHGRPYEEDRFRPWEEKILRDWPAVLMFRPGVERGERRGFKDPFDRIFEDGFGVVYPYGTLLPSLFRRKFAYREYLRALESETSSPLPLYTAYLDEFLSSGRLEEALQVVHALAGVIVPWPLEGLLALARVIGHPDPTLRRAVVRTLAEAFNRRPEETLQFLKTSGAAISDDDLLAIKVRQDALIGRRQISEEEWARIVHFLFARPGAHEIFVDCARDLIRAESFPSAVRSILHRIGRIESAER